jgi:hypothetical protein
MDGLKAPDPLVPKPHELFARDCIPETISGWKAVAEGFLLENDAKSLIAAAEAGNVLR